MKRSRIASRVRSALLCGLPLLTACHDGNEPAPAELATPTPSSDMEPSAVDPRDQYTLAHEIAAARRTQDGLETALARTRAAWKDRRYRWELAFVPELCRATGPCVALPFDHARDDRHPIRQGWLPRLQLDSEQRKALAERCRAHRRCVLDVSGRLAQFELSVEAPPSLTLAEVRVHGTRNSTRTESWVMGARSRARAG
ncbi:MAG: hypothetical protein AAF799_45710 [Myxococcota bacterium]